MSTEIQVQTTLANRTTVMAKGVEEETNRTRFIVKIEAKGEEAELIAKQRKHWADQLSKIAEDIQLSLD